MAALLKLGDLSWPVGARTGVFGVLNITPDSFSDGGQFFDLEGAVECGKQLVVDGADVVDVGGESTRPGYEAVTEDEEIARVVPVIESLVSFEAFPPISVDTTKPEVARAAIHAGATIVNDIWGFMKEPALASIVAESKVSCVLMHNARGGWLKDDTIDSILAYWDESISICEREGVPEDRILLDPGIGFTDTRDQDLSILRELGRLRAFGFPLLLGTSRKRIVGEFMALPIAERFETTLATTALAVESGVDFVRVHDVKGNARVAAMADLICRRADG